MRPLVLWRSAPLAFRIVAGLGFGAAAGLLALSLVPIYRSQSRSLVYFIVPAVLIGLSLWLLLERYQPVRPPQPPKPRREANEAVMPVPLDPPRAAVGKESA
jgi:ABC-type transport system involved in cytochrome c biogenesis permease subunit